VETLGRRARDPCLAGAESVRIPIRRGTRCEFAGRDRVHIRHHGPIEGAMLSRANLASNAAALAEAWHFTSRDVLLHTLPLFHVQGCSPINTVLASGSSLVLLSKFDAESALKRLPQVTVFMGVPTHYTRLLQLTCLNREVTANVRLSSQGRRLC